MGADAVRQKIEDRLNAEWGATTPIAWDNIDYRPKEGTTFIRVIIEGTYTENKGVNCQRQHYLLQINVMTPRGAGTTGNLVHCDTLLGIFTNHIDGNLVCTTGRIERGGQVNEWHQRRVFIDLYYDQFN